jgi:hypothetical protein
MGRGKVEKITQGLRFGYSEHTRRGFLPEKCENLVVKLGGGEPT